MNTRSAVLLALALFGGAHATSAPQAGSQAKPSTGGFVVAFSENGHPGTDGAIGVARVCVDNDGNLRSVAMIQPGSTEMEMMQHLRRQPFPRPEWGRCTDIKTYCDDCVATATAAGHPPELPVIDTSAPAATKFKNVAPQTFDESRLVSPLPRLPDVFKAEHINERLFWVAKVGAGSDGQIANVSVLEGLPGADEAIIGAIRQWRLRPQPNGDGVCTLTRLVYDISQHR